MNSLEIIVNRRELSTIGEELILPISLQSVIISAELVKPVLRPFPGPSADLARDRQTMLAIPVSYY